MRERRWIGIGVMLWLAACGSRPTPAPSPVPTPPVPGPAAEPPAIQIMLGGLGSYIAQALAENQANLPRNPQNAVWIRVKIAMLQEATLAGDILAQRRWLTADGRSIDGRTVTVALVFPLDAMRDEATGAAREVADALPVLEAFLGRPFPFDHVRIWYGFVIGNRGGSGVIYTEDRNTYELRPPGNRLPYDAILDHELSHTYIPHESLNQFLELYQFNLRRTGSTDVAAWGFTRNYAPGAPANEGVHALLDVYRAIGLEAMRTAYRRLLDAPPAYGVALSAGARQAFVDAAPPEVRDEVAALMARVTF